MLSALLRFSHDPKLLGLEWVDGGPPSLYVSPAREAILAAVLDAAQVRVGWGGGGGARCSTGGEGCRVALALREVGR